MGSPILKSSHTRGQIGIGVYTSNGGIPIIRICMMMKLKNFIIINWRKMQRRNYLLILCILQFLFSILLIENSTHFFRRIIDDALYDSYHHYLRCDELPLLEEVNKNVREHEKTVEQIKSLEINSVLFYVDSTSCIGRGSIVISYPSRAIHRQIEQILVGSTFFGIPITLLNQ